MDHVSPEVAKLFSSPFFIEHKVGDTSFKFFPVSVDLTFKLKVFAEPIAKLFAAFTDKTDKDAGQITRSAKRAANDTEGYVEHTTEAVSEKIIAVRYSQKSDAIQDFIHKVMSDDAKHLLASLIMDSLREKFPRGNQSNPSPTSFSAILDTPVLMECLFGVAKANKGVFDPFLRALALDDSTATKLAAKAKAKIESAIAGVETA